MVLTEFMASIMTYQESVDILISMFGSDWFTDSFKWNK